jgi:putative FmdB family regulatory protein
MPIYEYLCKSCSKHFERRQTISEPALTVCEECGGRLEKQWSLSGFQFKGEGWYVTDYSAKKPGAKDEKSESGSSEAKEKSSGGESTTAADTASKPKSEKTAKTGPAKE